MHSASGEASTRPSLERFLNPSVFLVPDRIVSSGWLEHAPFMFWLIETLAPRTYVELGTHLGYSYFVVCQTVRKLDLSTACYAVDTWQGDEHAGFYGQSVYREVSACNEPYRSFSTLMRLRFDEASSRFSDKSIDLLHVDGRHFYDDVKADFEAWRPKLTDDAVVLFHDTNVRERDFGVWRYFDELKRDHVTFEFFHGNGLGVLAMGRVPTALTCLFEASDVSVGDIRSLYAHLGAGMTARWLAIEGKERESRTGVEMTKLRERAETAETALQSIETHMSSIQNERIKGLFNGFGASRRKPAQPRDLDIVSKLKATGLFDGGYYRAHNPDVVMSGMDPLLHFVLEGCDNGRKPNELFDPAFYRKQSPDLANATVNLLLHFAETGWQSGLKPCPDFDPAFYLSAYRDVVEAGMNPLFHYIVYGRKAGRKPLPDAA